ncbi:Nucleotide-binding universal stress protein, UspA family [Natronorubrum sediminis]|uniref:Nucleotide-binding universal stress protein, UspA family n=1 Tax=Natronorubrum sediminis TaxID=640943 RepID=A0A1H6G0E0_9EURY|nr:universal stress protein [Natronorubrum sediminis]SEH15474.1 Nucleotide-binding universal stress protein, UspA family [Natronorubrum sediminis]
MGQSILVAHDGSTHAQDAFEYALETYPDAELVLFHAIDPFAVTPDATDALAPLSEAWLEEHREDAHELFEAALEGLETGDTRIETDTAVGTPAPTIVAYAADAGIDGIVVGNRGRNDAVDVRLGSTAELVVRRADVPVVVVR